MRELTFGEVEMVGGAGSWSLNGDGSIDSNGYFRSGFKFGNFGSEGINVSVNFEVARFDGKTYWGDRGVQIGFTKKW